MLLLLQGNVIRVILKIPEIRVQKFSELELNELTNLQNVVSISVKIIRVILKIPEIRVQKFSELELNELTNLQNVVTTTGKSNSCNFTNSENSGSDNYLNLN